MILALNLLAGTQKPPRKQQTLATKAVLGASVLALAGMLGWSGYLETRIYLVRASLNQARQKLNGAKPSYEAALEKQAKLARMNQNLAALQKYTAHRFLNGPALNALQQTTVEDIELTRLQTEQSHTESQPGLASGTARTVLHLEGADSSSRAGAKIEPFKEMVSTNAYFSSALTKSQGVTLKNISPPQLSPSSGRFCVLFKLDCLYPETKP